MFLRSARRSAKGGKLLALLVLLVSGCGRTVSEEECRALLDQYTEAQIDQARPSTSNAERLRLRQAARERARLDPEFRSCPDRMTRRQLDCAMAAHTADQIERCLL